MIYCARTPATDGAMADLPAVVGVAKSRNGRPDDLRGIRSPPSKPRVLVAQGNPSVTNVSKSCAWNSLFSAVFCEAYGFDLPKFFDILDFKGYFDAMNSITKICLTALTLFVSSISADAESPRSSSDILFEGFLGDGAVYSIYGYSKRTRNAYAAVHVQIPGSDQSLDVARRVPHSQGNSASVVIRGLYTQARLEVSHIVAKYGGADPGHNTFRDREHKYENTATDPFGNSVSVVSKAVRTKDCVKEILNENGTVNLDINGEEFVLKTPSRVCFVKAYISGMWARSPDKPATAAALTFLSEDGDYHVLLAHKRPPRGFLAKISESATRRH